MKSLRRLGLCIIVCAVLFKPVGKADGGEGGPVSRSDLVHNLAKFVVWPEEKTGGEAFRERVFCSVGSGVEDDDFFRLQGKRFRGGTIACRRLNDPADLKACDVVVFQDNAPDRLRQGLLSLEGRPVFTVSGMPGFSALGGMVELIAAGDRVSFHVNLAAAKRATLIIKTPLLQMATIQPSKSP